MADPEDEDKLPAEVLDALGRARTRVLDLSDENDDATLVPDPNAVPKLERLGLLGRGGVGEVLLARDPRLRRHVALKVLRRDKADRGSARVRFVTEAQLTAQLDHPHIVPVYAMAGEGPQELAYTMKLVQGQTLREVMDASADARKAGGAIPDSLRLDALLEHLLKLCDALAYAHTKRVVHRDVKPENVMVGSHGELHLMDWGLARVRGADASLDVDWSQAELTQTGQVFGTPLYMAPEQARGDTKRVGPWSDQYAVGLILQDMITGRPARPADMRILLTLAAEGERLPMKPLGRERIPRELAAIVARATAKVPEERYRTVADLAEDVRRYRAHEPLLAAPDSLVDRARRWVSRNRQTTLNALVGLVALVALLGTGMVAVGLVGAEVYSTAAEAREARLTEVLSRAGARADQVDLAFSTIEAQLESVAGSATVALVHGQPETGSVGLPPEAFADERAPADTAYSASYDRLISTTEPDVVLAPGVDRAAVDAEIRRLTPVRHAMRRAHMLVRMALDDFADDAAAERAWRDVPGPIRWTTIGTPSGIYLEMPGAHWKPVDFDPRVRPWYQVGEGARRPRWGRPFQEASTGTLLMPCSVELNAPDGRMLGTASLSVSFSYLIDRFLVLDHPAVRETFLVDRVGRVLVRSSQVLGQALHTGLDEHYSTPPFPHPELRPALGSGPGVITLHDGTLLAHYPLSSSGWSYVVLVDGESARSGP